MGKNYAQLHTPEVSKDFTRKSAHTPNLVVAKEPMKDLEEASDSTDIVYAKDDKLGCGGMHIIALLSFVVLGVLIGIGVSQILV
jgi:dihydrodipicolinate synthase/N-acetylneuraminate lyase